MKKWLALLLIIILPLTGCSNVLIADNTVLNINSSNLKVATINSINQEQSGKVCSLRRDGMVLSINLVNNQYLIDLYDPNTSTLVNLTTSDSRIFDVKAANNGFFYTRTSSSDPSNIQIAWSSYDKSTERTITEAVDSVDNTIFAYDNNKVIFINNGNELIFSDSTGKRRTYTLSVPVDVRKILWSSDPNIGFMIASELGQSNYNLYQIILNGENEVSTTLIETNVLDMDLNKEDYLSYIAQETKQTIVYEIDNIKNVFPLALFSSSNIEKLAYSVDGNDIIYSQQLSFGTRSTLWYFVKNSNEKIQLSSPIRLISSIFPIKKGQLVYSNSQQTYLESTDIVISNNYITNLNYTL